VNEAFDDTKLKTRQMQHPAQVVDDFENLHTLTGNVMIVGQQNTGKDVLICNILVANRHRFKKCFILIGKESTKEEFLKYNSHFQQDGLNIVAWNKIPHPDDVKEHMHTLLIIKDTCEEHGLKYVCRSRNLNGWWKLSSSSSTDITQPPLGPLCLWELRQARSMSVHRCKRMSMVFTSTAGGISNRTPEYVRFADSLAFGTYTLLLHRLRQEMEETRNCRHSFLIFLPNCGKARGKVFVTCPSPLHKEKLQNDYRQQTPCFDCHRFVEANAYDWMMRTLVNVPQVLITLVSDYVLCPDFHRC